MVDLTFLLWTTFLLTFYISLSENKEELLLKKRYSFLWIDSHLRERQQGLQERSSGRCRRCASAQSRKGSPKYFVGIWDFWDLILSSIVHRHNRGEGHRNNFWGICCLRSLEMGSTGTSLAWEQKVTAKLISPRRWRLSLPLNMVRVLLECENITRKKKFPCKTPPHNSHTWPSRRSVSSCRARPGREGGQWWGWGARARTRCTLFTFLVCECTDLSHQKM